MTNSIDVKKYKFETTMLKIMEDINILETTGITVWLKGKDQQIFGELSQFCGDSLAAHHIFGLVENFSMCDYCCSICYGKIKRSKCFDESSCELRTRQSHIDKI